MTPGMWLWILLGPAFHRLFLLTALPGGGSPSPSFPGEERSDPGWWIQPDRIHLRDTVAGGTLQVSLIGLTGGMASLEDLDEAVLQYRRGEREILGGVFRVEVPQPSRVAGLRIRQGNFEVWGGEERHRMEEVWVDLEPGVYGPYLVPGLGTLEDVEVWWKGRPLPPEAYTLRPDGTLILNGFPEILEGDRLLVRFPAENRRFHAGGRVQFSGGTGVLVRTFSLSGLSPADYDTVHGIVVFVGRGRGRVAPLFLHAGPGRGAYVYDPLLEAFRYVGEGRGTHNVRLPDLGEQTFVGFSGTVRSGAAEIEALHRDGTWRGRALMRWDFPSGSFWAGVQDTGVVSGRGHPYRYNRWVGMNWQGGWGEIRGETDMMGREGWIHTTWRGSKVRGQFSALRNASRTEAEFHTRLNVEEGWGPTVQLRWTPEDTSLFAGLALERSGITLLAGLRYQDSLREEARIVLTLPHVRGNLLLDAGRPVQGELRWTYQGMEGRHRRERGFFPEGWTYDTLPGMLQRHTLQFRSHRIEVLWDEKRRYAFTGWTQMPWGWAGGGWREGNVEAERFVQFAVHSGPLWIRGEARGIDGTSPGTVLDVEGGWRWGIWEILGGYAWRQGAWTLRRRSGGAGWILARPEGSLRVALWYHDTRAPAWLGGVPRGLEIQTDFQWTTRFASGTLTLQAGLIARQDGWVLPTATFSLRSREP